MWQDTSLDEYPEHYFCPDQYLIADSAFRASRCVIPTFARSRKGVPRPREHDVLNTAFEAPDGSPATASHSSKADSRGSDPSLSS
jgi:hypothetical protein